MFTSPVQPLLVILILSQLLLLSRGLPLPSPMGRFDSSRLLTRAAPSVSVGLACNLPLRGKTHTPKCELNNIANKAWRFDRIMPDKLVSERIPDTESRGHCDHTLEINLLDKLIGGGAKKLGVSAGELCSRLFPPGNIGSTRASEVKSIMEDQSNLFFMPAPVNQAKKNLLLGFDADKKTPDGKMYRKAVAEILAAHKSKMLATADSLIAKLQSFGDLPPNTGDDLESKGDATAKHQAQDESVLRKQPPRKARPSGMAEYDSQESQEVEDPAQVTAASATASSTSSAQETWRNPFVAPPASARTYQPEPDKEALLEFDYGARVGVALAWRTVLERRIDGVISRNRGVYTPSGRKPGEVTEPQDSPSTKVCRPAKKSKPNGDAGFSGRLPRTRAVARDDGPPVGEMCPEDEATSISGIPQSSSSTSSTKTATRLTATHLATATLASTHSTPGSIGSDDNSTALRPNGATLVSHTSPTASFSTKAAISQPPRVMASAVASSPTSRILAPAPTRSSVMAAQSPKPISSRPTPVVAPASGARVPSVAPPVQAPAAKRPISALSPGGSKLPKLPARPLTIRRSLD